MKTVLLTPPYDVDILARLHAASFADAWSAEWIAKLLAQPGTFAFVAGGEVGGFILVRAAGGEAEILTLAVAPAARRRGVGSVLVSAACQQVQEMGAEAVFLEVGRANEPAKSLYKRLGFHEAGRRRGYYQRSGGGNEDALIFRVELPLPPVGNSERLD
ncbi:MAG: ribosomal protein S18-alanine N-acetyltransferase [Rhizomicrobium sp.]|jgi:ribosomal-protein-alanine N-acetyltransferase